MIGIKNVNVTREGGVKGLSTMTIEILIRDNQTTPLRKRFEMVAIGLVMMLATTDADLAYYVTSKLSLDPEKYKAILALIGCTQEELQKEDAEDTKGQFKPGLYSKQRVSGAPVGGILIEGPPPPGVRAGEPCARCGAIGLCLCQVSQ